MTRFFKQFRTACFRLSVTQQEVTPIFYSKPKKHRKLHVSAIDPCFKSQFCVSLLDLLDPVFNQSKHFICVFALAHTQAAQPSKFGPKGLLVDPTFEYKYECLCHYNFSNKLT